MMGAFFDLRVVMNIIEGAVEGPGDTIQDAIKKLGESVCVDLPGKGIRSSYPPPESDVNCMQTGLFVVKNI